jgi:hypothetical protein
MGKTTGNNDMQQLVEKLNKISSTMDDMAKRMEQLYIKQTIQNRLLLTEYKTCIKRLEIIMNRKFAEIEAILGGEGMSDYDMTFKRDSETTEFSSSEESSEE